MRNVVFGSILVLACSGSHGSAPDDGAADDAIIVDGVPGNPAGTGASQASCGGGTCSPGTFPTATANIVCGANGTNGCTNAIATPTLLVDPGSGTAENRSYGYYIPSGLKHDGSPDGMP